MRAPNFVPRANTRTLSERGRRGTRHSIPHHSEWSEGPDEPRLQTTSVAGPLRILKIKGKIAETSASIAQRSSDKRVSTYWRSSQPPQANGDSGGCYCGGCARR